MLKLSTVDSNFFINKPFKPLQGSYSRTYSNDQGIEGKNFGFESSSHGLAKHSRIYFL